METQSDLLISTLVLRIMELEDIVRMLEARIAYRSEASFTVDDPTPNKPNLVCDFTPPQI